MSNRVHCLFVGATIVSKVPIFADFCGRAMHGPTK